MLESKNPEKDKLLVVRKRRSADSEALKVWKVRSGKKRIRATASRNETFAFCNAPFFPVGLTSEEEIDSSMLKIMS